MMGFELVAKKPEACAQTFLRRDSRYLTSHRGARHSVTREKQRHASGIKITSSSLPLNPKIATPKPTP